MWTFIEQYGSALLMMLAEMAPYLLLGFFFAGLLHAFVPKGIYKRHLAPSNMKSVVKAAAIGIPLPLCSCGVIPTSVGLRREGASHGACTSFLIATPQTGVDSIAATYSLMGLPFAIFRPIAALVTAMLGGWLVNRAQPLTPSRKEGKLETEQESNENPSIGEGLRVGSRLKTGLSYAFVEMLQDVGKWLIVGLLIAALITVTVPNEWLAALHEYKLLNMLIVLAVAVPMYVCATGSIPIAVSLMAKGLTPGAALVLLMAGPAVNSASMLVIGKVFGKRTLKLYLLSIIIGAVGFGLCVDYLLPQSWFHVNSMIASGAHSGHCLGFWQWLWIVLFVGLLVNAFCARWYDSHKLKEEHDELQVCLYKVDGMACNHCKANVEKAISDVPGVEAVEVDLAKGIAYVRGRHDTASLIESVANIGFEASLCEDERLS